MRQEQDAGMNAQGRAANMNARSTTRASNRASASGQFERRSFANEGRLNASMRERRGYADACTSSVVPYTHGDHALGV
jgi:hypothetical protein